MVSYVQSVAILMAVMINLTTVYTWPSGAPEKTCTTLFPRHGGTAAKEAAESPYTLTQSLSNYQPNDQIKGRNLRIVLKESNNLKFYALR